MQIFPPFYGDTGKFTIMIRGMYIFELPLFPYGPGTVPGAVDAMVNRTDISLSSCSSQPTWEKTNKESMTKMIRPMINPLQEISSA